MYLKIIQVRSSTSAAAEDEDVAEERRRISEMKLQEKENSINDRLVVKNLTKVTRVLNRFI